MHAHSNIQFLTNNEINKQLWNDCIKASPNGLIYVESFYLDNICMGWNAVTGENYEWVLPITYKTKWGIPYLYQPPFTQQLGVFAKPNVYVPYSQIIEYLQQHYKFWEISWNYATPDFASSLHIVGATNFILDLSQKHEDIQAKYHNILTKNLKQNKRHELRYCPVENYHTCIQLYKKQYGNRIRHVKETDYQNFSNICKYLHQQKMIICREAVNKKDELLSSVLLLTDGKRLYNIMNVTTAEGRKINANHFLLDAVIREFSDRDLVFDFEGSDLPGVKSFYEYFGGENQPYFMIKYNDLAWPVKLFKQ